MPRATYEMSGLEIAALLQALVYFQGSPDCNGLPSGVYETVDHVVLMLETADEMTITITYEEPD